MRIRSLLITAALVAASSCSETVVPVPVAAVQVTPGDTALHSLGDTFPLEAVALDGEDRELTDRIISWASSNVDVAAVTAMGVVTATGNGTAVITATAGGVSGTATIVVAQVTTAVELTPASTNLTSLGDTVRFVARALDARGNIIAGKTPEVAPTDTDVLIIAAGAVGVSVGNGEALVIAAVDGKADSATVSVQQVPAQLAFMQQPLATQRGVPMPDVTVAVRDARGNPVAHATAEVSIALGPTLHGGVLSGPAQASTIAGIATFAGLSVDVAGAGYTLSAAASGVPFATSEAFRVLDGPAAIDSLALATPDVRRGASTPYQIRVTNGAGRTLTGAGTQAYILQNGLHGGGGSVTVGCHPTVGVVPHGSCTMNRSLSAPAGLALGPAVARIVFFEGTTTLASVEVPINIVP